MFSCILSIASFFLQNDRDLLRATAVTRGWSGYRNKSCCFLFCFVLYVVVVVLVVCFVLCLLLKVLYCSFFSLVMRMHADSVRKFQLMATFVQ